MKEINITEFVKNIHEMRKALHENLIVLMDNHKAREIDCFDFDDTPIIFNGLGDDCMTLDRINYHNINGNKVITFGCSGSWNNDEINVAQMDIELLIEVYEWIMANEDILFNQYNEE